MSRALTPVILLLLLTACSDAVDDATVTDPLADRIGALEDADNASGADLDALAESTSTELDTLLSELDAIDAELGDALLDIDDLDLRLGDLELRVADLEKVASFSILVYWSSGECQPNRSAGNLPTLDSCVRDEEGVYTLHWPSGTFEQRPACTVTALGGGGGPRLASWLGSGEDSTTVEMWSTSGGGHTDWGFSITCDALLK